MENVLKQLRAGGAALLLCLGTALAAQETDTLREVRERIVIIVERADSVEVPVRVPARDSVRVLTVIPLVKDSPEDSTAAAVPVGIPARVPAGIPATRDSTAEVIVVTERAVADSAVAVVPVVRERIKEETALPEKPKQTLERMPEVPVGKDSTADSAAEAGARGKERAEAGKRNLREEAGRLCRNYSFEAALKLYETAMETETDSTERLEIEEARTMAENSLAMTEFCHVPEVVAKRTFSAEDFFLYYPFAAGSWRPVPNALDTAGNGSIVKAMYAPEAAETLYYTTMDEDGIRNIHRTSRQDSVWTAPELLGEALTTSSDELFPVTTANGKALFFSSKGLYGMGGYDLYVSRWEEEQHDWGVPVNLGFPYSSPCDDFLYMNTDDGRYSIFASNRGCAPDSVCIYVLKYDSMPVRKAIKDPAALRALAKLEPEEAGRRAALEAEEGERRGNGTGEADGIRTGEGNENGNVGEDGTTGGKDGNGIDKKTGEGIGKSHGEGDGTADSTMERDGGDDPLALYSEKMSRVRVISDSLDIFSQSIEKARARLAEAGPEEYRKLAASISAKEARIPALQDALAAARKQVQEVEMRFLAEGVVIDADQVVHERREPEEQDRAEAAYVFTRAEMGRPLDLRMAVPEQKFDYSFMILPEGRFAEDNRLPDGLVYQIQIFTQTAKAGVRALKGLSPVFEQCRNGGRTYSYSVGVFRSYQDVLDKLNKVKKAGFRSAFITAYKDGERCGIREAREAEAQSRPLYTVRFLPADGNALTESELTTVKALSSADLVKSSADGGVCYLLGPFDDKTEAEAIVSGLKSGGFDAVSLEVNGK